MINTYPEEASKPEKDAPLATYIYGNRFHADQTLYEYLIEFLLVFCSEKSEGIEADVTDSGKLHFHDPNYKKDFSYLVEPRMGLKRFIFFDKDNKSEATAQIDRIAYQELFNALSTKIDGDDNDEKREFLESLQDLFHGYVVVLKKRTWCAQAILPICPELVFCEAMPKKKARSSLSKDTITSDIEKERKKVDELFDFDKRNFLARGGELYYLHILQGIQNSKDNREKLEQLLQYLLKKQGKTMSRISDFIQTNWEEHMGYTTPPKKRMKLAYIPENAYKDVAEYSVSELINFLSCSMHSIKKIELLSKGVMLQVLRMLSVATAKYLNIKPECWIVDMKGMTKDIVKKIASSKFRNIEECFNTSIAKESENHMKLVDNYNELAKEIKKAFKDSMGILRSKGKELECIIPLNGPVERFSLSEDCIRFLVLSMVQPGEKMTIDMFLNKLYLQYQMVIGPAQYKETLEGDATLASSLLDNQIAFQDFLKAIGLLHELSDATSVVVNPYNRINLENM